MGLRESLARFGAQAPVPVFPLLGRGSGDALTTLEADSRLDVVSSPRAANVLLLVGGLARGLLREGCRVHDQMSHPRTTLWWPRGAETRRLLRRMGSLTIVESTSLPVDSVRSVHTELLSRARASEGHVLPDVDPEPWRGLGPYGQGGKGMTGGVPYGRPMAGRAPDRDGLELDQLRVRVGPFFLPFPPGLTLDVDLQGDLVQNVVVRRGPVPRHVGVGGVFASLASGAVSAVEVRTVELARARHHLQWLSHFLRGVGLGALADRALCLAREVGPDSIWKVRRLRRTLERPGTLGWSTAHVAPLPRAVAEKLGGPGARASGVAHDARSNDPAYGDLDFEPVVHTEGDARARWRQRLAETEQALDLAGRAGSRVTVGPALVEGPGGPIDPHGRTPSSVIAHLPTLLTGLEWGDAVTAVASLDLGSMVL